MRPLISYYGGKQRIASKIVEVIDTIPHTVYVEPFAGGLAVFYRRTVYSFNSKSSYREVINDRSEALINLYSIARSRPEEFDRIIQLTPYSRSEHKKAVKICKDPSSYSKLDWAWAYYVNINQSFCKQLNGGWGTSVFGQHEAATWVARKLRIPECLERLKDVHIECGDALNVIQRWDSPQTLFYCDPPYPNTSQGHYDGYSLKDWLQLCDQLDLIQGSYILSNYPQEIEPKSAQKKLEINAICSAAGSGKVGKNRDKSKATSADKLGDRQRTEVLWVRDQSKNMRKELKLSSENRQLSLF
jgi:DNA adenine methylase